MPGYGPSLLWNPPWLRRRLLRIDKWVYHFEGHASGVRLACIAPECAKVEQDAPRRLEAASHENPIGRAQHKPMRIDVLGHLQARLSRLNMMDHGPAMQRGVENAGSRRGRGVETCTCPPHNDNAERPLRRTCTTTTFDSYLQPRRKCILASLSHFGAPREITGRMTCMWDTEQIVSQSSHTDTLRASSSPTASYSGSSDDSSHDDQPGVAVGNTVPQVHCCTFMMVQSGNAEMDRGPHEHHNNDTSYLSSFGTSHCSSTAAVLAARLNSTWRSPGYDLPPFWLWAMMYPLFAMLFNASSNASALEQAITGNYKPVHHCRPGVKQPMVFLLPPGFPGGDTTIACFGNTDGCKQWSGKQPKVKFGGIANRAIRAAFWNAGFQETSGSDWSVLWGSFMQRTAFRCLKSYQKCNHWPGTWELGEWEAFQQHVKRSPGTMWIRKPLASSRGRGIRVVTKPSAISPKCKKAIVQLYVQRPLCINGYKFDLRVYMAVTSFQPLRAYLYGDALVRFASVKYDRSRSCLKNRQIHLTNHAVNRKASIDAAHSIKWPLSRLWDHLRIQGIEDCNAIVWRQVEELCALALLAAHTRITSQVMCHTSGRGNCFEIFGVDLILTESLVAKVLEVNTCPALSCTTDVDRLVKFPMLAELLHVVGIRPAPRKGTTAVRTVPDWEKSNHLEKDATSKQEKINAGEHARKWRNAPLENIGVSTLPKEITQSEAEWTRLNKWAPCLPPVHASLKLQEIYTKSHWTHEMLMKWIATRSRSFPAAHFEASATEADPSKLSASS